MQQLEVKKYLFDIQKACSLLQQFVAGKARADYDVDVLLRSAVERQLTIAGEALSQLLKIDPTLAARISESRQMIGFRNVLVHGYSKIDNEIVWEALHTDLPKLQAEVTTLLQS